MADPAVLHAPQPDGATAVLVFADGQVAWGRGFGAVGEAIGEMCFNTAMTGYQEVMTDPSYAAQIVCFTFPHIGNVGVNDEDTESVDAGAVGCVVREDVTDPSNFRSMGDFPRWLADRGRIGIAGLDTRALTRRIRRLGAPNVAIAHDPDGRFDLAAMLGRVRAWQGLEGLDLAKGVSRQISESWAGDVWQLGSGFGTTDTDGQGSAAARPHVVAMDFGSKNNIFRTLVKAGARVTVVPAEATLDTIMALKPDGVFLSNGPGDPAATGAYAVPVIRGLLDRDVPIFGICLGHQMLGLAAGARTAKMFQGHRGANHPVQRLSDGTVEITSMNHGFAIDGDTLPAGVEQTHVSLFDGTNCGIEITGKKAFGVQYHPEASPGPQDSFYLFERFVGGLGDRS
ncbi:glutamine-hydrolyzing carbamoyl-phosphate synthase small subunit [Croceicoccus sp. F390]|uniref:Carbamoyl phosphate synthase small chain n=1 Tax=Croceicoccus esteveae TaxID=3075597 RepID=A0ABU2ZFW4_9SPHN|nr:glutamine-hydrolyzing carbamoyl-phosphate synthase small subunit [Croceicoccus sp. F390]MDT0575106.1 glutamine-hydrolyzing carbamoyl-phosphate synthase small subunit [Croceicoccus sp. F390]